MCEPNQAQYNFSFLLLISLKKKNQTTHEVHGGIYMGKMKGFIWRHSCLYDTCILDDVEKLRLVTDVHMAKNTPYMVLVVLSSQSC
jgi:hypothetical protein